MVSWAEQPLPNAVLAVGWLVVAAGAVYRYRQGRWSRRRAVAFVAMAAGWLAQSVPEVAPAFGVGSPAVDYVFAALSLVFLGGVGYEVYRWRVRKREAAA